MYSFEQGPLFVALVVAFRSDHQEGVEAEVESWYRLEEVERKSGLAEMV